MTDCTATNATACDHDQHMQLIQRNGDDVVHICDACGAVARRYSLNPIHPTAATTPDLKGGCGHSGKELEETADHIGVCIICCLFIFGVVCMFPSKCHPTESPQVAVQSR